MSLFNDNRYLVCSVDGFSVDSFYLALSYLSRSDKELLYNCNGHSIRRLLNIGGVLKLIEVSVGPRDAVNVYSYGLIRPGEVDIIRDYIEDWFGLKRDVSGFYNLFKDHPVLESVVSRYRGLRVIGIIDLYEALVWAIIGQQVNLSFAYEVKRTLVENYGPYLTLSGVNYYHFPAPSRVLEIGDDDFRKMKFSRQKVRYIRIVSEKLKSGSWVKSELATLTSDQLLNELTSVPGIGPWTANYVLLRCFHRYEAFPKSDAGLHQALRRLYDLDDRPSDNMLNELGESWYPWQGLMTFYLWFSLLSE